MYFLLKVFLLYLFLLLIPKASQAEFVPLKKDQTKPCSLKLSQAKQIPHQCQIISDRSSPLAVWQDRLAFDFGKISQQDFIQLKNAYSGWSQSSSAVVYEPDRTYQLIDFLPPLIQALNGYRFIPESIALKEESYLVSSLNAKPEKSLYMNCWGLIYEVLRAAKNAQAQPTMFMAQSSVILQQIREHSENLLTLQEPTEFPLPPGSIQPGDFILVLHQSSSGHEYLDHIAIAIDDGIYFEKAGTGEDVPIRLIDEATLSQIWPPGVFRYEVRRLDQNAFFPAPQEAFSLRSPQIKQQFFSQAEIPLNLSKSTTITWDLEQSSPSSIYWFEMVKLAPLLINDLGRTRLSKKLEQPLLKPINETKTKD